MGAHSKRYSPSSFARRMVCPASAKMEENLPDTTSVYAEEGTLAHAYGSNLLEGEVPTVVDMDDIPKEMEIYVNQYADYVRDKAGDNPVFVEDRVSFEHLAPDGFGTVDAWFYDLNTRTLWVIDLKYGKGVRVSAKNNAQHMLYAIGVLNTYASILWELVDKITLVVHQPRLGHVDEHTMSISELKDFEKNVMLVVAACEEPEPRFGPTEEGCRFCKARGTCKARTESALSIVAGDPIIFEDYENDLIRHSHTLSKEELATVLPHLKALENWVHDVRAYATGIVEAGQSIAGYKLVHGKAYRMWRDPDAVAKKMKGMRLKHDDIYQKKLISPAQAQKLVNEKRFHKLEEFIVKPNGKPTLVPTSDKRPAITLQIENLEEND